MRAKSKTGLPGVSILRFITEGQESEPRVLKAQLTLAATAARNTRITSPVWALACAILTSTGLFGHVSFAHTVFLPLAVTAAMGASALMATAYQYYDESENDVDSWLQCFVMIQAFGSLAWGLMPWLCWEPGNPLNHMFLAACTMAVIAGLVAARGSNMKMYVANLLPLALMTCARFVLGDSISDMLMGAAAPFIALQMWFTGRPLVLRMGEDARLRFKVEDLARELEETRDEALKKRFEAEAANASKTAFLANMSHELRTPLNAILGFSDIIANRAMGDSAMERYSDYARDIHHSGDHLLSLINDLLDVAKIEAGRMEIDPKPVDPFHVMENVGRLMAGRLAAKRQEFSMTTSPDLPLLLADERALKQMLLNLVSNAVKFTPPGGHVTVTCGMNRDGGMEFCVDDDGPGIPKAKLARIFQPFSQIDNRFDREAGGTGLGLALVQGLVQLHGGRAWLESEPGQGTRAHLYFPSIVAAAPRREIA